MNDGTTKDETTMSKRFISVIGGIALAVIGGGSGGCANRQPPADSYETVGRDPRRNADAAARLNRQALDLMDKGRNDDAASTLQRALSADVMCGPAHNNLGKVYYRQGKLYLAAWEFRYAVKLMPNQPEPKNNLGLVFEAAGKFDEAVDSYGQAMGLEPDNPQIVGNLARARVRRGDKNEAVRSLLSKLVSTDARPEWVNWAKERLATMPVRSTDE